MTAPTGLHDFRLAPPTHAASTHPDPVRLRLLSTRSHASLYPHPSWTAPDSISSQCLAFYPVSTRWHFGSIEGHPHATALGSQPYSHQTALPPYRVEPLVPRLPASDGSQGASAKAAAWVASAAPMAHMSPRATFSSANAELVCYTHCLPTDLFPHQRKRGGCLPRYAICRR